MGIYLRSNIAALTAQRKLGDATNALASSFERLASGQRINKASDDSAGLAIALSLKSDTRVYTQAVRNVNDAVSAISIVQGALEQLTQLSLRQKELAQQAANGTYTLAQRRAMNTEADALVDEFNRIVRSTSFNGLNLTDGSLTSLQVQAGYGTEGSVSFAITEQLSRTVGTGSFRARTSFVAGDAPYFVELADLNGDQQLDMVTADNNSTELGVMLGNGNGTFGTRAAFATGPWPYSVAIGDLNNDNRPDLVTTDSTNHRVGIFFGNGNGTFGARTTISIGKAPYGVTLSDLNNDSALDIITGDSGGGTVSVMLGRGDGSFGASRSFMVGAQPRWARPGDFNNDGVLDLVTADRDDNTLSVLIGNGDGSFRARTSIASGTTPTSLAPADVNRDGLLDVVSADYGDSVASVFLGNGDGSFRARALFETGAGPLSLTVGDLNGDGLLDLATADASAGRAGVLLGNGDGSFKARSSFSTGTLPDSIDFGDLNGDTILDMVTADRSADMVSVFLASTERVSTSPYLNLLTRTGALEALSTIDATLQRVSNEMGTVAGAQSRLAVTLRTLSIAVETGSAAAARIEDIDVAEETSRLMSKRILQHSAAAVLAQANQQPALALQLLAG